jgi:hypothetical protein
MGIDTKTYWLTDRQSQCDFDFDFEDGHSSDRSKRTERIGTRSTEVLEVSLWRLNLWLEDFIYV